MVGQDSYPTITAPSASRLKGTAMRLRPPHSAGTCQQRQVMFEAFEPFCFGPARAFIGRTGAAEPPHLRGPGQAGVGDLALIGTQNSTATPGLLGTGRTARPLARLDGSGSSPAWAPHAAMPGSRSCGICKHKSMSACPAHVQARRQRGNSHACHWSQPNRSGHGRSSASTARARGRKMPGRTSWGISGLGRFRSCACGTHRACRVRNSMSRSDMG